MKNTQKFEAMTPAQKRVAIAKDVIKQMGTGKIRIQRLTFGRTRSPIVNQQTINKSDFRCTACAVGSAVVCGIRLFNKLNLNRSELHHRHLNRWFGEEQTRLIEMAFEMGRCAFSDHCHIDERSRAAVDFGKRYHSNARRAKAIFENIIANKGTFKP